MIADGIAWVIAAMLLAVLIVGVVHLVRIRHLLNHVGSIQVALRFPGKEWRNGIATLGEETLDLYSTRSLRWRPAWVARRSEISFYLEPQRAGVQIVTLRLPNERWHLASSPGEVSALLSWIDSAAPAAEPNL